MYYTSINRYLSFIRPILSLKYHARFYYFHSVPCSFLVSDIHTLPLLGKEWMRCTSRYSTFCVTSCASIVIGKASGAFFSYVTTSSYITSYNFQHKQTTVSVVSSCLWIGTTVPGSNAINIRWLLSAEDVRKSKLWRYLGFIVACSNSLSKKSLSNSTVINHLVGDAPFLAQINICGIAKRHTLIFSSFCDNNLECLKDKLDVIPKRAVLHILQV